MPPKAKFTREEIIEAAMQIFRENGLEAVTARELGKRLGSSARPIFTVFESMEEVHGEIIKAAKAQYKQYVTWGLEQTPAFKGVGTAYIRFAMEESRLFQLLFMQEQGETKDLDHVLENIDENYQDILKSVEEFYGLNQNDAKKLYQHLWIYTHGIATLCATKVCMFTVEEIQGMMSEIFIGLLEKVKRGESND